MVVSNWVAPDWGPFLQRRRTRYRNSANLLKMFSNLDFLFPGGGRVSWGGFQEENPEAVRERFVGDIILPEHVDVHP